MRRGSATHTGSCTSDVRRRRQPGTRCDRRGCRRAPAPRALGHHDEVEGFVALFHEVAVISIYDPSDRDDPREVRGAERLARIPELLQRYTKTFHMLGQSTYDIGETEATGEVYCIAHH